MRQKFKIEDLITILLDDNRTNTNVSINLSFRKINILRDKLRQNDIIHDLGANDIETFSFNNSKNVHMTETGISIILTNSFMRRFEIRRDRSKEDDIEFIKSLIATTS